MAFILVRECVALDIDCFDNPKFKDQNTCDQNKYDHNWGNPIPKPTPSGFDL